MMDRFWSDIASLFGLGHIPALFRVGVVLLAGVIIVRILRRLLERMIGPRTSAQTSMLLRRGLSYAVYVLFTFLILAELGFDAKVLFGAAGILTVAIGFASQTSASNLISGLFLIGERPFVVSDIITIADTTGEIVSIDLMSIKIRTFDNLYVRIPNEAVIKATVTNLTHYPIRRLDLTFDIDEGQDLSAVRELLLKIADQNPVCMDEPRPLIIFKGFGVAGLTLQYSVWAAQANFPALRNSIAEDVKIAFDAHDVKIAYPSRREVISGVRVAQSDASGV